MRVWDCDTYKSLGPNKAHFGSVKEFWENIKGDFMRFISDFHVNERLPNLNRRLLKVDKFWTGSKLQIKWSMRQKKKKKELILFKVDFEKGYDSVEWDYLELVMAKKGFLEKWRKWILECVGSLLISVLVNGSPVEEFAMQRFMASNYGINAYSMLAGVNVNCPIQIFGVAYR
ncbi:uncharacterized protein [Cicer arietinum]|uniref:Uncharacterized protein LOC101514894 n=1 Tax=Cicer arietinum TaxID=3827 RepID=A0A1S2Z6X2_CICAR|nr:uncharacterized protein LOC101514894 [Cicer arietinum]